MWEEKEIIYKRKSTETQVVNSKTLQSWMLTDIVSKFLERVKLTTLNKSSGNRCFKKKSFLKNNSNGISNLNYSMTSESSSSKYY